MTQQDKILQLLKQAGSRGINSYGFGRKIALQLPRVMNDLRKAGYLWTTRHHKNRSVDYVLISEPEIKTPKVTTTPVKMTWITYKNAFGENMAKQVPINPIDEANLQQQLSI